MSQIVPVPASVRGLLSANTHPGLQLDKYVASWDATASEGKLSERVQKPAVQAVARLSEQTPPGFAFPAVSARRLRMLEGLQARTWNATTTGPLTLHLARASALENAGICLHPLYGFVYLPGTGLKGLAHAYACEVWLPAQPNRNAAWDTVCTIFGWAPAPWLTDLADRLGVRPPQKSQAGAIVFHDAWPVTWPRLVVDLLNNHHVAYYQKGEPPGDWDSPVPVYLLAVPSGQSFSFAVSKRRDDLADALLEKAERWLAGGLVDLGVGAKTATGYGGFRLDGNAETLRLPTRSAWEAAKTTKARAEVLCTLELVAPAFLAGANQQADDCELRPTTLRGLLRWWWRTLHAGFVDVATLRRMEATVWGDTATGGAVRVAVEPVSGTQPLKYDKFFLQKNNSLPPPPNNKTTQGLWYHTFGMDDTKSVSGAKERQQRWFVAPGARWHLRLIARRASFPADGKAGKCQRLEANAVLDQALAALWLFCRLGAAGSKARKGFGSFVNPPELSDLDEARCRQLAADFRRSCAVGQGAFDPGLTDSPALEQLLPWDDLPRVGLIAGWPSTKWVMSFSASRNSTSTGARSKHWAYRARSATPSRECSSRAKSSKTGTPRRCITIWPGGRMGSWFCVSRHSRHETYPT
jgi:CRISPR-associated protein Cmr6